MKNSRKNLVILLLIFCLSILLGVMIFVYRENEELKTEITSSIKQNDSIQNTLLNKNKKLIELSNKIQKEITSLKGSNSHIDGIIHDNKPISLEELINITNKFENENVMLHTKIYNDSLKIERLNSILNQLEKDKVINRTKKGSFTYRQITKVDSLYNASLDELSKTKTELKARNTLLKLIKDNYGIDTEVEYGADTYTARLLNTKKLDSALWILPYYKHKIKTNKKGETIIK